MRLIGKKPGPEPEPERPERPEPVVLAPKCREEAYLTVRGGLEWDREHGIDPG
jgi:hypothetical protein